MTDTGAEAANERAYRKGVLDRLDRIIALLTPPPVTVTWPQTTIPPPGYTCAGCGSWIPYGTGHVCGTVTTAGPAK